MWHDGDVLVDRWYQCIQFSDVRIDYEIRTRRIWNRNRYRWLLGERLDVDWLYRCPVRTWLGVVLERIRNVCWINFLECLVRLILEICWHVTSCLLGKWGDLLGLQLCGVVPKERFLLLREDGGSKYWLGTDQDGPLLVNSSDEVCLIKVQRHLVLRELLRLLHGSVLETWVKCLVIHLLGMEEWESRLLHQLLVNVVVKKLDLLLFGKVMDALHLWSECTSNNSALFWFD